MKLKYRKMKTRVGHPVMTVLCLLLIGSCAEQNHTSDKSEPKTEKIEDFSKETYAPKEYSSWVQGKESPLKKESAIGEFIFSALYKPHEYIICMEERNPNLADSTLKRKISEIADMEYYDLKIELTNGKNEILKYNLESAQQYTDRVNHCAFGMQRDIVLVLDNKDTIPCGLYHFERAYDVAPFVKVMLGFKKSDSFKEKTLVFNDGIFGNGVIRFNFTKKELNNVPKLKTL